MRIWVLIFKAKKKENLYITLINIFIAMGVSFLLKGSILAVVFIVIVIGTIIFIERNWIYENVFRKKKRYAMAGYSFLAALMLVFIFLITSPSRDTSHIIKLVNGFFRMSRRVIIGALTINSPRCRKKHMPRTSSLMIIWKITSRSRISESTRSSLTSMKKGKPWRWSQAPSRSMVAKR